MLEEHVVTKRILILPDYIERYRVGIDGEVFDTVKEKTILPDSTGFVEIVFEFTQQRLLLAWVIAMAFKPLFRAKSFCKDWTICFKDNNQFNLLPSNLIWTPPIGGQPCPEANGFRIIPGRSAFAINPDGVIYSRYNDCIIKTRESPNGYLNFSCRLDTFTIDPKHLTLSTMGVPRALGLAFIPVKDWTIADSLQINHKDGNKLNNRLDNLEWVNNSKNTKHAYANKLNVSAANKQVLVHDVDGNLVTSYQNVTQAMFILKLTRQQILDLANKRSPFDNGLYLTVKGNNLVSYPTVAVSLFEDALGERVILRADSPYKLSKMTGTTIDKVMVALSKDSQWPCENFVYYWLDAYTKHLEDGTLRSFSEIEKIGLRDQSGIIRPIQVTWLDTGKKNVFKSVTAFCKYMSENADMRRRFPSGGDYPGYFGKHFSYDCIER